MEDDDLTPEQQAELREAMAFNMAMHDFCMQGPTPAAIFSALASTMFDFAMAQPDKGRLGIAIVLRDLADNLERKDHGAKASMQ